MGFMTIEALAAELLAAGQKVAARATTAETSSNVWLVAAVTLLGSSLVAGLVTSVLGNLRAAATARRDGYANAVRVLIARAEYPYRVRRRVSDDPEVLAALVSGGHELQEQLAACRTWVKSEHRVAGVMFERALTAIDSVVYPSTADAWAQPPITSAVAMNLAGWGPGSQWSHLESLERAIAFRFGWRRLLPAFVWSRRL